MDCITKEGTRITNVSSTLIDVILTTTPEHFQTSGTLDTRVSDDKLIFSASAYQTYLVLGRHSVGLPDCTHDYLR